MFVALRCLASRRGNATLSKTEITEPEILDYDEPTSGIDPLGARIIDGLIERMRVLHGVTSVVISHDMVTAYDVADQVVLLASGKAAAQRSARAALSFACRRLRAVCRSKRHRFDQSGNPLVARSGGQDTSTMGRISSAEPRFTLSCS